MVDALARAGVRQGLSREVAQVLAIQTMRGTAALLDETGQHPEALVDGVASPGGTTIAAIESARGRRVAFRVRRCGGREREARRGAWLVSGIGGILYTVGRFYGFLIIVYVLMSWLPKQSGIVADVYRVLGSLVEPYLSVFRRFIPPMGGMDFSPIVAIIVLQLLIGSLARLR